MPRGIPNKPKEAVPIMPDDSGALIYKDRAGVKLGGGPTEGKSYMGTIADEARRPEPSPRPDAA